MTLQAHLSHDLPDYVPTKHPVRVFKEGQWWTWQHRCLHRWCPTNGYPHASREEALEWALKHWRKC